jgi:glycosyltransferase involved in cell wall biosynthesis
MHTLPLVSIITPSYNHAEFLDETIRSVLAQDYANIEYIVVDGGSTDGSVETIKRYQDRIAKWVSEPDAGQSDAINKGFRMATGEIVAWLNSDDLYFPDAVSTAVRRFQQDPLLGLFYSDCVFVDRDGQFLRYFTEVEPYSEFRLRNCSDFVMQPSTFFRRETLFEIGLLDTSLHYCMDWDLWCRFAKNKCRIHYEPKLVAASHIYGATKTQSGGRVRLNEVQRVMRRHRTSPWPHAYFGYMAHDVATVLSGNGVPRLLKLPLTFWLCILRGFSVRNMVYGMFRARNLYGIQRWSNCLFRTARICFPMYRRVRTLDITLHSVCGGPRTKRQEGSLWFAGEEHTVLHLSDFDAPRTFRVAVPESSTSSGVIDIRLRFRRANSSGISARLMGLRAFR